MRRSEKDSLWLNSAKQPKILGFDQNSFFFLPVIYFHFSTLIKHKYILPKCHGNVFITRLSNLALVSACKSHVVFRAGLPNAAINAVSLPEDV